MWLSGEGWTNCPANKDLLASVVMSSGIQNYRTEQVALHGKWRNICFTRRSFISSQSAHKSGSSWSSRWVDFLYGFLSILSISWGSLFWYMVLGLMLNQNEVTWTKSQECFGTLAHFTLNLLIFLEGNPPDKLNFCIYSLYIYGQRRGYWYLWSCSLSFRTSRNTWTLLTGDLLARFCVSGLLCLWELVKFQ